MVVPGVVTVVVPGVVTVVVPGSTVGIPGSTVGETGLYSGETGLSSGKQGSAVAKQCQKVAKQCQQWQNTTPTRTTVPTLPHDVCHHHPHPGYYHHGHHHHRHHRPAMHVPVDAVCPEQNVRKPEINADGVLRKTAVRCISGIDDCAWSYCLCTTATTAPVPGPPF